MKFYVKGHPVNGNADIDKVNHAQIYIYIKYIFIIFFKRKTFWDFKAVKNNQTEKEDGIFQLSPIQSRSRIELMKSNTFHRTIHKVVLGKANVNDASQNA